MIEQERLQEREPCVRRASFGHDIGHVLTGINVHKLDNALSLGLPSAMIVKYVETTL